MQNNHRVALVTGGSGGIGRITAARLARGGFEVAVNYAGSKDAAEEVVSAHYACWWLRHAVQGDVADEIAMKDAFEQCWLLPACPAAGPARRSDSSTSYFGPRSNMTRTSHEASLEALERSSRSIRLA